MYVCVCVLCEYVNMWWMCVCVCTYLSASTRSWLRLLNVKMRELVPLPLEVPCTIRITSRREEILAFVALKEWKRERGREVKREGKKSKQSPSKKLWGLHVKTQPVVFCVHLVCNLHSQF